MAKYKMVDTGFINIVKRQTKELLNSSNIIGSDREKLEGIQQKLEIMSSVAPDLPTEFEPGVRKSDLVDALGLKVYDYELPAGWVDEVRNKMDFNVVPHFVYGYDDNKFGRPVPITSIGKVMLRVINRVCGTNYPIEL